MKFSVEELAFSLKQHLRDAEKENELLRAGIKDLEGQLLAVYACVCVCVCISYNTLTRDVADL